MRSGTKQDAARGRKGWQTGLWLGWLLPAALAAAGESWRFEKGESWTPAGEGIRVLEEPEGKGNGVCEVLATKPHHQRVTLPLDAAAADCQLSLRYRVMETEGEAPRVYLYGRSGQGGFRALSLGGEGEGHLFCYEGKAGDGESFGTVPAAGARPGEWVRASLACLGERVFGKVWLDGAPEPGWQVWGRRAGQDAGTWAFGVWTSPRTASRARVWFDDVSCTPLTESGLGGAAAWLEPPPALGREEIGVTQGVFRVEGRTGLASARMALAFEEQTGEIVNLIDRVTGREFIGRKSRRPLFQFQLTNPKEGRALRLDSRGFRKVSVQADSGETLILTFTEHPQAGLSAEVRARLVEGDQVALRLRLRNSPAGSVATVGFPGLGFEKALGGADGDDRLLLPWAGGAVLDAPGRGRATRWVEYPGAAVAQFFALYDDEAGLYCGLHDGGGHCKRFGYEPGRQDLGLPMEHRFPEVPGGDVELAYDVCLTTFQGDWRDAAEIYKSWAVGGLWTCPKLADRPDVPAFLKEGAGVLIVPFRDNAEQQFGVRGEKLLGLLNGYREKTGVRRWVAVPYGWENRGTWAGIHYLPARPSNEYWAAVNQVLREADHRTAFLLSGYWWVTKRRETSNGPAFDDSAEFACRQGMCAARPDGSVWLSDFYDKAGTFGDWRGLSAELCHGSREAGEVLLEQFLGVARLGTPLLSFDQEIGGGQHYPCYRESHGHAPGFGPWMWEGFRELCAQIREKGREVQPELGLFLENESELAVPWMATFWSRQFGEVDIGVEGGRGVGLFSYLYHEYVTAIGAACVQGQGAMGTRPGNLLRCRVLANNLTRGLLPGPFQQDVPLQPGKDGWKQEVAAAFLSFCRPYAHFPEYLVLGRTRRPAEVECEDVETWYWRKKPTSGTGAEEDKRMLRLPAVICGCFEAGGGSLAHFVVNATPQERKPVLRLPAGGGVEIYSAERQREGSVPAGQAERRVPLTLEPFGVRVLVVQAP